jgi:hypothetical protein
MTHFLVAADAPIEIGLLARIRGDPQGAMGPDFVGEAFVAAHAIGLEDLGVPGLDADGFLEILEGESPGMVVAIAGLHEELVGEVVMGKMAIVAGGGGVMGAMPPVGVFLLHDVAVHTDLGVVRHVGKTLGGHEGIGPRAQEGPDQEAGRDAQEDERLLELHAAGSHRERCAENLGVAQLQASPPPQENRLETSVRFMQTDMHFIGFENLGVIHFNWLEV